MDHSSRPIVIWIALFVDLFGQALYIIFMMVCEAVGPKAKAWFDSIFEFYPAINIEHRTERMNGKSAIHEA